MNRLFPVITIFLAFWAGYGWAQPAYKATLPAVDVSGYYKIELPYDILGPSRADLGDIRIKDEAGREVAWLLRKEIEHVYKDEFVPYRMEIQSGKYQTDIRIETDGKPVSSFIMRVKNAESDKKASLMGSHDGRAWYAVKEHLHLDGINNPHDTESLIELNFPLSDYRYYKMSVKDSLSSPLNILGIGRRQTESSRKQLQVGIPLRECEIHANDKFTDIRLVFPFKNRISELVFYISAPQYYMRNIKINSRAAGMLVSDHGKPLAVACNQYVDTLVISVYNGDDRPLAIDSIKAYTPKYCLIAGLEKGVRYSMTYGDESASMPGYDLSFSLHLPDSIALLMPGMIEKLPVSPPQEPSVWMVYFRKYGIWTVIVLIILQVLYVVRRLLK